MSVALVYPAPNATSVPDTFNQVVIGTSSAFGDEQSWNIYLQPNGVTGGTLQSVYPPFPTPYAIPAFDNPTYYSSSFVGQTFASETVTVYLENPSTYCAPMTLGNFKTQ
jgi:hypothetical protein